MKCAIGEDMDSITFSYRLSTCSRNSNNQGDEAFCEDCAQLVNGPITMVCEGGDGEGLDVEPEEIRPGEPFTVTRSSGRGLPDKIDCFSFSEDGTKLQQNVIDTSGDVPLDLHDDFGAMRVEACDRNDEELRCIETLVYEIELENTGNAPMDVTRVDITIGGVRNDLIFEGVVDGDEIIDGGDTLEIEYRESVDICQPREICAVVDVMADPPNGDSCQGTDEHCIEIAPIPTDPPTPGKP